MQSTARVGGKVKTEDTDLLFFFLHFQEFPYHYPHTLFYFGFLSNMATRFFQNCLAPTQFQHTSSPAYTALSPPQAWENLPSWENAANHLPDCLSLVATACFHALEMWFLMDGLSEHCYLHTGNLTSFRSVMTHCSFKGWLPKSEQK